MKQPTDHEAQAAIDAWASKIASLEPAVAAGVAAYAGRLASDRRLPADDRRFAAAQANAVRRALRRAKGKTKAKAPATKPPARKPGKKS